MKKQIVVICCIFFTGYGYAQDIQTPKKIFDVSISLEGFGGDYVTNSMGVQAGVDFRINKQTSMQCDARYIFDVPSLKGYYVNNVDNLQGLAVGNEIKFYAWKFRDELQGGYYGSKLIFMYTEASRSEYTVKRGKVGAYGILGWKYIDKSGFLFEASGGVGIQLISSYSSGKNYPREYQSTEFPWSKKYDSGTSLLPDITANIRIGWRF
ncbi:MAG: hypothetical protein CO098_08645 [Bacteroidetes bacterium CG_4_9_14_3_um_filter_41_19]|nr:MAG: hypothetical protein CO098_08645 [Bacteroidetes bacterium CG_4_9_14_3_um_filter_41_19]